MKVLRVIASMDPASGGPCQGIRNAIPELKKLGMDTEVVCLDAPDSEFISKDDFKIYALGPGKTSWCFAHRLMTWLGVYLRNYDVVIVHGLWQFHGFAVRKVLKFLRQNGEKTLPAFYVMPHGMLDPYFQKASGRKLKAIRNWFYWKLIESKIINNADGIFFTCEEELILARTTFTPYHPKRELNVGYGIEEPPPFDEHMKHAFFSKCPEVGGKSFILFLSRIHNKKGVDLLIEAYENMVRQFAGKQQVPLLVVAGPGMDTPYGQALKTAVDSSAHIREKVFFPGMLGGEAKWGAFYTSEAFILPSHQENFGISVAEALACSKPVLISDQVNIWREIEQSGAGFIAHDDVKGVESLLDSWMNSGEDQKKAMAFRARQCYIKHFAIAPAARKVFDIINTSASTNPTITHA